MAAASASRLHRRDRTQRGAVFIFRGAKKRCCPAPLFFISAQLGNIQLTRCRKKSSNKFDESEFTDAAGEISPWSGEPLWPGRFWNAESPLKTFLIYFCKRWYNVRSPATLHEFFRFATPVPG